MKHQEACLGLSSMRARAVQFVFAIGRDFRLNAL